MVFMETTRAILKLLGKYGLISKQFVINIMQTQFLIYKNVIGRELILESMMEFPNLNMIMLELFKKLGIYQEDKYILDGLLIGIKTGKPNLLRETKINLDS